MVVLVSMNVQMTCTVVVLVPGVVSMLRKDNVFMLPLRNEDSKKRIFIVTVAGNRSVEVLTNNNLQKIVRVVM
jgi:hypothetical protein